MFRAYLVILRLYILMDRKIIAAAAFFGMTAVILGAFGAHKLKELLTPQMLASFETGVRYQMYHAFALLLVGLLYERLPHAQLNWAGGLFTGGIVLFSGSLYLLAALKAAHKVGLGLLKR